MNMDMPCVHVSPHAPCNGVCTGPRVVVVEELCSVEFSRVVLSSFSHGIGKNFSVC